MLAVLKAFASSPAMAAPVARKPLCASAFQRSASRRSWSDLSAARVAPRPSHLLSHTRPDSYKFVRCLVRRPDAGEYRRVNRIKAVQQALDGRVNSVYLEIGVERGWTFRRIAADEKIAVDPAFKLSARSRRLAAAKARATHYFETTSDAFFANETAFLEQRGIDVALIDGLHTYRQVLRDVENTLRYLRDDGVIVLHDCNPTRVSIACPASSFGSPDISVGLVSCCSAG
jgi:hypothetical protein